MKTLLTSHTSDTAQFPVKSGTWDFIQAIIHDEATGIWKALNYDAAFVTTTSTIVYGLRQSPGATGFTNWSAGAIITPGAISGDFYLILVPSQVVANPTGGNVFILNADTPTYETGSGLDPVTYSDTSTFNTHQTIVGKITTGAAGSGAYGDLSGTNALQRTLNPQISLSSSLTWANPLTVNFASHQNLIFSATLVGLNTLTFDFTNAIVGAKVKIQGLFPNTSTFSITVPSGSDVKSLTGACSTWVAASSTAWCVIECVFTGIAGVRPQVLVSFTSTTNP